MAHTIIIQSVARVGDSGTASGTIDGQPFSVSFWWSALTALPSTLAVQNFLAGLAVAALPAAPVSTAVYNGTIQM